MPGRYAAAQRMGMDEETVSKIHDYEKSDLPEHVKLALRFTEAWVLHNAQIIDDDLICQMRVYFTESQIVELAFTLIWVDGSHKFRAAFDIDAPEGGVYQVHTSQVGSATKRRLKDLGFPVVARGISLDPSRQGRLKAIYTAQGEDIEDEITSRLNQRGNP